MLTIHARYSGHKKCDLRHPEGATIRTDAPRAIGADAATAIAQVPRERRQVGHSGVEGDEEVVTETVVLGESELGHDGKSSGTISATGSCSMCTQRMRGSRRNHRS